MWYIASCGLWEFVDFDKYTKNQRRKRGQGKRERRKKKKRSQRERSNGVRNIVELYVHPKFVPIWLSLFLLHKGGQKLRA